jgi:hypothetical protein
MARVREAQFNGLLARHRGGLLRAFLFVHLKKDLEVDPIDWTGCRDPWNASEEARPVERRGPLTTYGIRKDMQQRIAALRTDLDSFSEAEAYALMASGYRMIDREVADQQLELHRQPAPKQPWDFLAMERLLDLSETNDTAPNSLLRLLEVGGERAFKVWHLSRPLQIAATVLGLLALAGLVAAAWHWREVRLLTVGWLGAMIALVAAWAFFGKAILRTVSFPNQLKRVALALSMSLLGFAVARLHLWLFDPLFLRRGRIEKLVPRKEPASN